MQRAKAVLLNTTAENLLNARREYMATHHNKRHGGHKRQKRTLNIATRDICPYFSDAYLAQTDLTLGEKSISPYKGKENYVQNR